jgi:hypothetical protein
LNDGNGGADYAVTTQTAAGTITPVSLVVKANSPSIVYGSPLPTFTYTISGFVGGDTSSVVSGSPVLSTTAAAGAGVANYPITVAAGSLSATNYIFPAADLIGGTLTVTPATLVITASSATILVGQSLPPLTASYTGFVNGDTAFSLTSPPVIQTAASPSVPPGSYPISISGASSPNYAIKYVLGTLTVVVPPATVDSVSVQSIKLSKHKTEKGIVVQFSGALDAATAESVGSYSLAMVPKNKKQKSKSVVLSKAIYNSSTFTVTLLTKKPLALNPPVLLTIKAANFTAILKKGSVTVTSARSRARFGSLSARAVDAVLEAGVLSDRRRLAVGAKG